MSQTFENSRMPIAAPSEIWIRNDSSFLDWPTPFSGDFSRFDIRVLISVMSWSYMFRITAIVPPLMPGIILAIPMATPWRIVVSGFSSEFITRKR